MRMQVGPDESPADEYERRVAERRNEAAPDIELSFLMWLILHGAAFLLGVSVSFLGPSAIEIAAPFWLASLLPAIFCSAVVIRRWGVLSVRHRVAGMTPAAVMLAEMSLPALMGTLRATA